MTTCEFAAQPLGISSITSNGYYRRRTIKGDREGYVFALDARTGKPLWKFYAGGTVIAPPISYELNGRQYIAVAAGGSLLAFSVPR